MINNENIAININEIPDEIPKLLEEKDILTKTEEGINYISTHNQNNEYKNPVTELEQYLNLKRENIGYDSEDENLLHMMDNMKIKNMPPYKKLEFKDVEYKINQTYYDINHKFSSALDILASYLKGHKIIYMESKSYCETHLNLYMVPSIFISTAATVLSSFVNSFVWGPVFISALNGIIALLLAIVNYLKLDAASEAHKISSHQYDKLQTTVEFTSGSVLLFRYNGLQNDEYEVEQLKQRQQEIKKLVEEQLLKKEKNLADEYAELESISKVIFNKETKIRQTTEEI